MSQIKCGTMKAVSQHANNFAFLGDVALGRRLAGKIALLPVKKRDGAGSNAPDYEVLYCDNGERTMRTMGSAWLKHSDTVSDFLSMTLDDPDWMSPLNLTAFPPNNGEGDYRIVWSRPRAARVQDEAA